MQKIVVIGAGPVGLATVTALQDMELDASISLLDPFMDYSKAEEFGDDFSGKVKTKFNSSGMYQYPEKYVLRDKRYPIHLSSTFGGLSTVWGAGLDFDVTSLEEKFDPNILNESVGLVKQIFPKENGSRVVSQKSQQLLKSSKAKQAIREKSLLAIDWDKCTYCGKCLTGCPNDAIWDSRQQTLKRLSTGVKRIEGFAVALKYEEDESITIEVEFEGRIRRVTADLCFVASGPVASSALLQRSKIFPRSIQLMETRISYMVFLTPNFARKRDTQDFSASQIFVKDKLETAPVKLWMSLFDGTNELREKSKRYLHGFERLVPMFLFKQVMIGIHYLPTYLSGSILLNFEDTKSEVKHLEPDANRKGMTKKYLRTIRKLVRDRRLIPLTFLSHHGQIGSSFHVGVVNVGGRKLLDDRGSPKGIKNVHVVDSSSLPSLEVGPITALAMINAVATVKTLFNSQ